MSELVQEIRNYLSNRRRAERGRKYTYLLQQCAEVLISRRALSPKIPISRAIADSETLYLLYWRGCKSPVLGVVYKSVATGQNVGSSSTAHGVTFTHVIEVPK